MDQLKQDLPPNLWTRWQWTLPAIHEIPCPSRNRAAASFSQRHTSATPPHQSLCAANTHPEQMRICTQLLHHWMTTGLEIFYLEMATNLKIPSWAEEYRSLRCIQKQQAESTSPSTGCWSKALAPANLVDIHNSERKIPGRAFTYITASSLFSFKCFSLMAVNSCWIWDQHGQWPLSIL